MNQEFKLRIKMDNQEENDSCLNSENREKKKDNMLEIKSKLKFPKGK